MDVAQLVERLLQLPEIRGSNPAIGKYIFNQLYLICIEKTKRIGKETRNGNLFKWSNPGLFCFFMLFSCDIFAEKLWASVGFEHGSIN